MLPPVPLDAEPLAPLLPVPAPAVNDVAPLELALDPLDALPPVEPLALEPAAPLEPLEPPELDALSNSCAGG